MVREFNDLEEIQKYYNKETDTYIFKEDNKRIDLVKFNFDLYICSDIDAYDIKARDINARNINAFDINACKINARNINAYDINASDINARDITYWGVCFAYGNIFCNSIIGYREKSKHFVLDGKIEIAGEE